MTNTTNTTSKSYASVSIKKIKNTSIEIEGSIDATTMETFRKQALKNINETIAIDGFRKGKVPENILVQKVGGKTILEEMAELAISKAYPEILINEKIDAIGRPEVHITKLARGNPLEFTITTAVVPTFELPNYKNIAEGEIKRLPEGENKVTDVELDKAILSIRKGYFYRRTCPERSRRITYSDFPVLFLCPIGKC